MWGREYSYEGATLNEYERNGYSDSDWYATVYDDKTGTVVTFEYSTTRFACYGNYARIDATPEYIAKAIAAQLIVCEEIWHKQNVAQCKEVEIGREVAVLGGRKHKNKKGIVRWIGISPFKYSKYNDTCRIETAEGESIFMDLMRVEVINPDQYLKDEVQMRADMVTARSNMVYKWGAPAEPSIVFVVCDDEMAEREY